MNLQTKTLIAIGGIMLLAFGVVEFRGYQKSVESIEDGIYRESRALQAVLVSMRRVYQRIFIEEQIPINDKTIRFLPAHSVSRISRQYALLNKDGVLFNNVSDRPRNPLNQADAIELEAMDYFRKNPQAEDRFIPFTKPSGDKAYHFTAPLRIITQCLICHGEKESAPESIRQNYDNAYGYKLGELRGILSIKLPAQILQDRLLADVKKELILKTLIFLFSLVLVSWLLNRILLKRMNLLSAATVRLSSGDYSTRLDRETDRDMDKVSLAFNNMAKNIGQRETELKQSREAYRTVIDNMEDVLFRIDNNGYWEFLSPAWEKFTSNSVESSIGKQWTDHVDPRDHKHCEQLFNGLTSSEQSQCVAEFALMIAGTGQWLNVEAVSKAILDEQGKPVAISGVIRNISRRKEVEKRLEHQAHHDSLTHLPNRILFKLRLDHAIQRASRNRSQIALLFLDLDNFKEINDSLGHAGGDILLQKASVILLETVRQEDTVARQGGDEFLILVEQVDEPQGAAVVAEKILDRLREPFSIEGQEFLVTGSIGVSIYPEQGEDVDTLIKNADAAMYRAKELGRNGYQFFSDRLTAIAQERQQLKVNLRHALKRNEFRLHYQPQVALDSYQIVGMEALIRWEHPETGLIPPNQFIPFAEETGLIEPIGQWVLSEACRQAVEWQQAGLPVVMISVNLSARQLEQPDIVSLVQNVLNSSGLNPAMLELEITESMLMGDADRAIDTLKALKSLGIALAIDDFGTGYSSLSYLKRFPVDKLKIDREFVRNLPQDHEDLAITRAIIALGQSLNLQLIAEGVETTEQYKLLLAEGCEQMQGYLFSPAVPAEEMKKLLTERKTVP